MLRVRNKCRPGRFERGLVLLAAVVLVAKLPYTGVLAREVKRPSAEHALGPDQLPPGEKEIAVPKSAKATDYDAQETLCLIVESAARANALPLDFFARVIWQESRFQSQAVGPLTRAGRAQGIAQFMPDTAKERGLFDPLNPVQALPKAAEFLNELRSRFGNLGLAIAAYNAGPHRVQEWLAGTASIPQETQNYVFAITGRTLENWVGSGGADQKVDHEPKTTCRELVTLLGREPNRFVSNLQQSVARSFIKPWGVQISSGFNRDQALAMYASAIRSFSATAGRQEDSDFEPILFRTQGTSSFYQVRIGANSRLEANNLCKKIRLANGACLVKRATM